jgi:ribonucrease Y
MNWMETPWWVGLIIGVFGGAPLGYVIYRIYRAKYRRSAEVQGQELVDAAQDRLEILDLEQKEFQQEVEEQLWGRVEKEFSNTEERIEELEEKTVELKEKLDKKLNDFKSKVGNIERMVQVEETRIRAFEVQVDEVRKKTYGLGLSYSENLLASLKLERSALITEIQERLFEETQRRSQKSIDIHVDYIKENVEILAKQILDRVYSRFQRAYSAERGIAPVYFETQEQRKVILDPQGQNLKLISELTGCDLFVDEGSDLLGVAGFDPVRRELTRRILERCMKEKRALSADFIRKTFENIKRELMSLIKRDGDAIAKELKVDNLHPEIRQMMGSLRYRYSFTQNQYFHCGEVGWLCGLLDRPDVQDFCMTLVSRWITSSRAAMPSLVRILLKREMRPLMWCTLCAPITMTSRRAPTWLFWSSRPMRFQGQGLERADLRLKVTIKKSPRWTPSPENFLESPIALF